MGGCESGITLTLRAYSAPSPLNLRDKSPAEGEMAPRVRFRVRLVF
jgi:hypothetical protein